MPLSEHVYCVAITFKMTEQVEQRIYIRFCIKLEHSSTETIWMIQKAAAMGNSWLASSTQQHTCSCIMSYAEIFVETSNHPDDSAPLMPRFGSLQLLVFPKTKTKFTLEREEISDCWWDSGKYNWVAEGIPKEDFAECFEQWKRHWANHKVPRCLLWSGVSCHCPMYDVSWILYLFQ